MNSRKRYQQLKEQFIQLFGRLFFHDVVSLIMTVITAIILLVLFLILVFRLKSSDLTVPLSYNSVYGVTATTVWYKLYFLPIAYLFISLLNVGISWAFFEKERLITYLTLFANIIIGTILIIMEYNLTILIRG